MTWPDRAAALPILAGLVLLAAAAWAVTLWQAGTPDTLMTAGVPTSLEMSGRLSLASGALFLLVWLVMMTAMMFPSVWPVVLLYAAGARRKAAGSVSGFVVGYVAAWEGFGVLAYLGYAAVGLALAANPGMMTRLPLFAGLVVVLAGLYQFTPWKRVCLAHCQGPLEYLASHWRDGRLGALEMGLTHGSYCLGCCWGLMLALLALGMMDLHWMVTVATVIAVEKLGPRHRLVPRVVGAGLMLLGVVIAFWPHAGMAGTGR